MYIIVMFLLFFFVMFFEMCYHYSKEYPSNMDDAINSGGKTAGLVHARLVQVNARWVG